MEEASEEKAEGGKETATHRRTQYKRQRSNLNMPKSMETSEKKKEKKNKDFWEKHFHHQDSVPWTQ